MGEKKRRSLSRERILSGEKRCIYCPSTNQGGRLFTLEHMPPKAIFRDRQRLSGLEFACCEICNSGTRGADNVASMMSFITAIPGGNTWELPALERIMSAVRQNAPGVTEEITMSEKQRRWNYTPSGLLVEQIVINANGPLLKAYLSVFASKLGMALYREHIGEPLPVTGAVFSQFFLNAGPSESEVEAMFSVMPVYGNLKMGKKTSEGQFEYSYNSDGKSIIGAFVGFHNNLFFLLFATSDPDHYEEIPNLNTMAKTYPGELVDKLSKLSKMPDLRR